ncbi:MAG: hypothetical protein NTY45_09945 [Elusimicrobia bacterium]|nr:hypothetical protein [Elusimicrobiota bacterium]
MKRKGFSLYACAFAAGLAALPGFATPARASYASEVKFQESLQALEKGDYESAMLGFMDAVVEDPKNDLARNYLKESGRRILEIEAWTVHLRRKELLRGAETTKKQLASLKGSEAAKLREWDGAFQRAKSLAGNVDSLQEAVSAYEEFIRKTPVYAELQDAFLEKEEIIRGTFYETIKENYSEMIMVRTDVDDTTLAKVFLSREVLKGISYKYIDKSLTESVLAKALQIKNLRRSVFALFNYETHALNLYSGGKFEQANALFKKVLACGANEEAVFYSGLASERTGAVFSSPDQEGENQYSDDLCPKPDIAAVESSSLAAVPAQRENDSQPVPGAEAAVAVSTTPAEAAVSTGGEAAVTLRPAPAEVAVSIDAIAGDLDSEMPPSGTAATTETAVLTAADSEIGVTTASVPEPAPSESSVGKQASVEDAAPASEPRQSEAAQAGAVKAADKLYELGVRAFSMGDYKAAVKNWSECLRINPGHTKAKLGIERLRSIGGRL